MLETVMTLIFSAVLAGALLLVIVRYPHVGNAVTGALLRIPVWVPAVVLAAFVGWDVANGRWAAAVGTGTISGIALFFAASARERLLGRDE